ncbi:MAG: MFS transporter [Chloroflexi bacterium]|nr:MFS transporter [Chloroflexota bacterium]
MALPPEFDEPARRGLRRLDAVVGRGQVRVFRVLWFMVPPGSIAWDLRFQALLASRFLTDVGTQALLFGALIAAARSGGGAVEAGLLGTAYLLPGALLGLYAGAVADALPKRAGLAGAYLGMGVLCLLIPRLFGTSMRSMLLILFVVRALHQVSQPSEASTVPLVATREELASATSFLSFTSSAGEVVGKALVAPWSCGSRA